MNVFEDNEATSQRVWFITDADGPYGATLTRKALTADDFVVAVSTRPERFRARFAGFEHALVCLEMDITDAASVAEAVNTAVSCFGQIDVLVNNTGLSLKGGLEAVSDADARQIFEVNLFGMLNVTRCVMSHMRQREQGRVINVSTIPETSGWGIYNGARRAIDGVSEALALDVVSLGIHVTVMITGQCQDMYDAQFATDATLRLVNETAPPLRLVLGREVYERTLSCLESVQTEIRNWARISLSADKAA
ncbi:MAG: SDR family NAD(P)-dependent oxidoreductase [Asticcacaulis sp.]